MLLVLAGPAAGQAPLDRLITGRVVDSLSRRGLAGAEVYRELGRVTIPTDGNGWFRFVGRGPLDTVLVVRRIGYVPKRFVMHPSATAEVDVGAILLKAAATPLDRITVEAEEVRFYPNLEGFYRRKGLGLAGFYLTREEIGRASARRTSHLVERTVKVKTQCNDTGNARWQKGAPFDCTARNSRPQGASGMTLEHCEMGVWVDGERSTMQVDDIPVKSVVALEVYSGPATTPAIFGSGHCGVVAIWTAGGTPDRQ